MRPIVLDLHGLKHEDVEEVCHRFVNENWGSQVELHIVTGHSVKMKSLVRRVLSMYDLEFEDGDIKNKGYIRIIPE
jgi:hypothetical protein